MRGVFASVRTVALACVLLGAPVVFAAEPSTNPAGVAAVPGDFDVRQFGAVGDGTTLNTAAFAKAIDACAAAGGGTVVVPAGRFLSGAIELKSHVRLQIDSGATLLASQDVNDYPLVEYVWADRAKVISSFIYAHDASDVSIAGRGTIDGQGAAWWAPILAAKSRHAKNNGPNDPTALKPGNIADTAPHLPHGRPQLIRLVRCSNVDIEGITLLNSPEWNVHPLLCDHVRVDGITITAHVPSPNTDGINPECCSTVQISNCRIDNGDDCITLKSGLDEAGRRMNRPDQDITITNCVTYHGHGGVTIGSEMSGGVRDVVVSNCIFHGTDNGIRIKSQRGRGGVVEGVSISNIVMLDVPHPFTITSFYAGKDKPSDTYTVNDTTPELRDILISNITSRGSVDAGSITGLREMPIHDVTFSNVHIASQKGFTCTNAADVHFVDCSINAEQGPPLIQNDCQTIDAAGLRTASAREGNSVRISAK